MPRMPPNVLSLFAKYFCLLLCYLLYQPTTAWALKKVWPEISLHVVPDAGHSSREIGITKLLVEVITTIKPTIFRIFLTHFPFSGHGQVCRLLNGRWMHA